MYTETSMIDQAPALSMDLEVAVQVDDLRSDWRRVSHLANYLAEYIAYDFPQRERAENLLSTITNEVLEAVVHLAPQQSMLLLRCKHMGNALMLEVEHRVKAELGPSYLLFVKKLDEEHDERLYLQMLTSDVKSDEYFNQLGLMILEYDLGVRLSLDMEREASQFCTHVEVLGEVLSK